MTSASAALLAMTMLGAPDGGGAVVVDRLVAAIGGRPFTASELELEARVALVRQGAASAATAALDEEVLLRALDYAVGQILVHQEVGRLKLESVEDEDVKRELAAFVARFPSQAAFKSFLARQDVPERAVAEILRRDLDVARYLDSRVRLLSRVEESEVRRWLEAHPNEAKGLEPTAALEATRAKLSRERAAEVTRQEIEEIRRRAEMRGDLRVVVPLGSAPRGRGPTAADAGVPAGAPR